MDATGTFKLSEDEAMAYTAPHRIEFKAKALCSLDGVDVVVPAQNGEGSCATEDQPHENHKYDGAHRRLGA